MENPTLKFMQREGFKKTEKVSQNGISYISVTQSSKSVPFQEAKKLLTAEHGVPSCLLVQAHRQLTACTTSYYSGLMIILAPSSLQFANVCQTVNSRNYYKQQWCHLNGYGSLYSRNVILHSTLKLDIAHELLEACRK